MEVKMKRKVLWIAILLCMIAFVGAQTSNTSKSTNYLFKTDVDNFMDVNNWSKVQPENFFGTFGYNGNNLNLGVAHEFKNFYFGGYFSGAIDGWTSTKTVIKDFVNDETTVEKEKTSDMNKALYFAALFGFDNIAVKASIDYYPNGGESTSNSTNDGENTTYTKVNDYQITPNVSFGLNTKLKDMDFATYAGLSLAINKDKVETNTYMRNDGYSRVTIFGNGLLTLPKKEKINQFVSLYGNLGFNLYPSVVYKSKVGDTEIITKESGNTAFSFNLTPGYLIEVNPSEKFAVKAKATVELSSSTTKTPNATSNGDETTYEGTVTTTNYTYLTPSFALGAVYDVIPSKLKFNCGLSFGMPYMRWYTEKTETRTDTNESDFDEMVKETTFTFYDAYSNASWNSGFTWEIAKGFSLDATWNILDNNLNNFTTDTFQDQDIWETVNDIFVHQVSFMLNCKF